MLMEQLREGLSSEIARQIARAIGKDHANDVQALHRRVDAIERRVNPNDAMADKQAAHQLRSELCAVREHAFRLEAAIQGLQQQQQNVHAAPHPQAHRPITKSVIEVGAKYSGAPLRTPCGDISC